MVHERARNNVVRDANLAVVGAFTATGDKSRGRNPMTGNAVRANANWLAMRPIRVGTTTAETGFTVVALQQFTPRIFRTAANERHT